MKYYRAVLADADRMRVPRRSPHRHRVMPAIVAAVLTVFASAAGFCPVAAAQPNGHSGLPSSAPKFLKLSLDSVAPMTITTSSDPFLVISGTITNIGDRVVDDVSIRVQRAAPITAPSGLRTTLRLDQINYDLVSPFEDIAEQLSPGQRQQFSLTVALRSGIASAADTVAALDITEPGIYPLLLNVNGEPAYGSQARLDDARFLLPVLGLPPVAAGGDAKALAAPPIPAASDTPVATTLVWPLADRPRLVAGIPGSVDGKALLTDDELAAALGMGGRLDQLLSALESALRTDSGRGRRLAGSLCLAVDPDLLITVSTMIPGYRVLASPSDPGGATREGTGAHAAQSWLDRLRTLSSSVCTVALPFAQVDLSAVAEVHDPELSARAIEAPADIVDSTLSVTSLRGVSLPDSGSIDDDAAGLLAGRGFTTAVLADTAVSTTGTTHGTAVHAADSGGFDESEPANPDLVRLPDISTTESIPMPPTATSLTRDPTLHVATFDIWSATALAAVGSNPPTPSFTPDRARYEITNDSRAARLQDALGAVSWSALNPQPGRPRSALLVPPQQWGANRDEATALLEQLDLLFRNGLATPRSFTDLLAQPPDPRPFELDYLTRAADDAMPEQFVPAVRDQAHRINDLMGALVDVPSQEPTPSTFLSPLRDDLVRTLTLSGRRGSGSAQPDTVAQRRLNQITETLGKLYRSVTVLPPGGVYTLASEQSPLLLIARNDLPVAIRIRFRIDAPAATSITDIGEQQLPAKGTRSFQIPTEVSDSRNLVIPILLGTPDGVPLGNATSVSVRSNAYGQALAIITACAGALLFLLAGRRLWRRFRGQSDPADKGLDPGKRRRVNRYGRARKRALQRQETQEVR